MRKHALLVLLVISAFSVQVSIAQQTAEKFAWETKYLLSLPGEYPTDTAKTWPLLIFLHGSGESGTDLEKVKMHGPPKLIASGKKFPFIVISPQAIPPFGWEPENLYHLLSAIKKQYRVDNNRIYLTGLSMGGFGTWSFAIKHPEEFAAIAPICGGGDTTDAWKLRHIPVRCFHGALDDVVPVSSDQVMIDAVKRYNTNVEFVIYPDANHNSWERTYNNDSLYDWLLKQKKFVYKEAPLTGSILNTYTGKYLGQDNDTIMMVIENNLLTAKVKKNTFPLKPNGNDVFFIRPEVPVDVQFQRNKQGVITSFIVYEDRRILYRKLAPVK